MIWRKLIYLLLDTLLIVGAFTSIATINGGQWVPLILAYYQPTEITHLDGNPESSGKYSGREVEAESSTPNASDCLIVRAPMIPEWLDAYGIMLAASEGCKHVQETPAQ